MGYAEQSWGVDYNDDDPDYGSFTLLNQRFPVARKNYRCVRCGGIIQVGTKHEYDVYMDGREFLTQRLHIEAEHPSCVGIFE